MCYIYYCTFQYSYISDYVSYVLITSLLYFHLFWYLVCCLVLTATSALWDSAWGGGFCSFFYATYLYTSVDLFLKYKSAPPPSLSSCTGSVLWMNGACFIKQCKAPVISDWFISPHMPQTCLVLIITGGIKRADWSLIWERPLPAYDKG